MLTARQLRLFEEFRDSTHENEHLNASEAILVGLPAAMAMNCRSCIHYYLKMAKEAGISQGKVSEIIAKVMVVSANQKRLQVENIARSYDFDESLSELTK